METARKHQYLIDILGNKTGTNEVFFFNKGGGRKQKVVTCKLTLKYVHEIFNNSIFVVNKFSLNLLNFYRILPSDTKITLK